MYAEDREELFFFKSGVAKLFGVLHHPDEFNNKVFVICSPICEEKTRTYRLLRNLAKLLASNGYAVLRFDYMGEGDSDGNFEDSTISTRLQNIYDAVGMLKTKADADTVNLLGLRFGGTLALIACSRMKMISDVIMWHPVVDCNKHFYNLLRSNLSQQTRAYKKIIHNRQQLIQNMKNGEFVNVDGYLWTWKFYKEATSIDVFSEIGALSCNTLVLQILNNKEFMHELSDLNHELVKLKGRHTFHCVPHEFSWDDLKSYNPRPKVALSYTIDWLKNEKDDSDI